MSQTPGEPGTPLGRANRAYQSGRLAEAEALFGEALAQNPRDVQALYALGLIRFQQNNFEGAQSLLGDALRLVPRFAKAQNMRGVALIGLKRPGEALACFDAALAIEPGFADAIANRATVLFELGRHAEALSDFDRALALRPTHAVGWNNRGDTLMALRRSEEAERSYARAVELDPACARFWTNWGRALESLGRRQDAFVRFEEALARDPQDIAARELLSMSLFVFLRFDEAAASFAQLLKIAPDRAYAKGYEFQCRLYCCEWSTFDHSVAELTADVRAGRPVLLPMALANFSHSAADLLACSRQWTNRVFPPATPALWRGEIYRHDKIRVAYLCPEFAGNPVATQLVGVFEHHDRSRFETVALVFGHDDDKPMRLRAEQVFSRAINIRAMSDDEAAVLMRELEIDIAVDLAGHTGNCRTGVLARRAAPVQVNYLGFPGSMGASYIDYIVADRIIIPDSLRRYYAEAVVHLPHTYLPTDNTREIAPRRPSRAAAGLPEKGFVFCSFNNSFKISPALFDVWMALLRETPGSVLWLAQFNAAAPPNLRREANARGVAAERLIFAPFTPTEAEHLARLPLADLFLDSTPYNAHSTACDALLMGLPVLTCIGETFPSRVAASLLHVVDLHELVTDDLDEYRRRALALAHDPAALAELRARLACNRDAGPLFDTARFTRNLQDAYAAMVRRQHDGLPPADIVVPERSETPLPSLAQ